MFVAAIFKTITFALNTAHVPAPRGTWEPSTVRAVLRRSLYRGVLTWDRTKKRLPDGSRRGRQRAKDSAAHVVLPVPHLRIVDEALVTEVDARLEGRRHAFLRNAKGKLLGRPVEGRHLLSGFIVCDCGGRFEVEGGRYRCSRARRRGPAVCASPHVFKASALEHAFLDTLEGVMLSDAFVAQVLDAVLSVPTPDTTALEAERARLRVEVTNLTSALAIGGDIPALVQALRARDNALKALDARLARPAETPDREALRDALEQRRRDWRAVLRGQHVAPARLVLQHLLELPLRIMNEPAPRWVTQARPGGLLAGIQNLASPRGCEDSRRWQPATFVAGVAA